MMSRDLEGLVQQEEIKIANNRRKPICFNQKKISAKRNFSNFFISAHETQSTTVE